MPGSISLGWLAAPTEPGKTHTHKDDPISKGKKQAQMHQPIIHHGIDKGGLPVGEQAAVQLQGHFQGFIVIQQRCGAAGNGAAGNGPVHTAFNVALVVVTAEAWLIIYSSGEGNSEIKTADRQLEAAQKRQGQLACAIYHPCHTVA